MVTQGQHPTIVEPIRRGNEAPTRAKAVGNSNSPDAAGGRQDGRADPGS